MDTLAWCTSFVFEMVEGGNGGNYWDVNVMGDKYGEYEMICDLPLIGHVNANCDWWMSWPCVETHKCSNWQEGFAEVQLDKWILPLRSNIMHMKP